MWGGNTYSVGFLRADLIPEEGNRPSFRNVVLIVPRIPDDGKSPKTQ
jgi:hypothetical protein